MSLEDAGTLHDEVHVQLISYCRTGIIIVVVIIIIMNISNGSRLKIIGKGEGEAAAMHEYSV